MARNEKPAPAEFTAIKAARKSNQPQLNISHAQVLALLAMSGQAKPEKGTPLSLGSPAKGKAHLIWTCATQTGETYRIMQGDTHGIWLSHQDGPGRDKFDTLLQALPVGKSALFRVVSVRYVPAGADASDDGADAIEVD